MQAYELWKLEQDAKLIIKEMDKVESESSKPADWELLFETTSLIHFIFYEMTLKWPSFRMSNFRLFISIDDSLSMPAKVGSGEAETILIGAKRLVKHFLYQTEKNPRLEIMIQWNRFISADGKPGPWPSSNLGWWSKGSSRWKLIEKSSLAIHWHSSY